VRPICDPVEREAWMKGLRGEMREEEGDERSRSMGRRMRYGVWNIQSAGVENVGSTFRLGA
jgi:hypothetical protein